MVKLEPDFVILIVFDTLYPVLNLSDQPDKCNVSSNNHVEIVELMSRIPESLRNIV